MTSEMPDVDVMDPAAAQRELDAYRRVALWRRVDELSGAATDGPGPRDDGVR
jgi:hypothetical protein